MPENHSPEERWLPVVGLEGFYEVSDQGRVRSLDRIIICSDGRHRRLRGVNLRTTPMKGYPMVTLHRDGRKTQVLVSRLVLIAFAGSPPIGHECAHWNGVQADNRFANLRWATPAENAADRLRHGTQTRGGTDSCTYAKLTVPEVLQIRELIGAGVEQNTIARRFQVSKQAICGIKKRRTWRHV